MMDMIPLQTFTRWEKVALVAQGLGGLGTFVLAILYWRQYSVLKDQSETQKKQASSQESQAEQVSRQAELQETVVELQDKQTEILSRQKELMSIEHKPNLLVDSWEARDDTIIINLTNIGGSDATNLRLKLVAEGRPETGHGGDWLEQTIEHSLYMPIQRTAAGTQPSLEDVLSPKDVDVGFRTDAFVPTVWEANTQVLSRVEASQAIRKFRDQDYPKMFFSISIIYDDQTSDDNEMGVFRMVSSIQDCDTLEDYLSPESNFTMQNWKKMPENLEYDTF